MEKTVWERIQQSKYMEDLNTVFATYFCKYNIFWHVFFTFFHIFFTSFETHKKSLQKLERIEVQRKPQYRGQRHHELQKINLHLNFTTSSHNLYIYFSLHVAFGFNVISKVICLFSTSRVHFVVDICSGCFSQFKRFKHWEWCLYVYIQAHKERAIAFIAEVSARCFLWTGRPSKWAPTWHHCTELHKFA